MAIKHAVMATGAQAVEAFMNAIGTRKRTSPVICSCGATMQSRGIRSKQVLTLLLGVNFRRTLYQCPECGKIRYPADEELGIEDSSRSPGVQRQVARLGAKEPFREVARDLAELAGISLSRKDAERIAEGIGEQVDAWQERERLALRLLEPPPPEAPKTIDVMYVELDGTGVPMVPHELAGRKGKQPDGSAKTREVKLGCVFTQTNLNSSGKPQRDANSTSFVGAIEAAAPFGKRLYAEAVRRGLFEAKRVVAIGDGAHWVQNLVAEHFGQATFIVDYYHASEHVGELCRALFDRDLKRLNRYRDKWTDLLADGRLEELITDAQSFLPKDPKAKKDARTQIGYFHKNKDYMRYDQYRAQGMYIGSGVIEAACKTIVCQRLKQSGMEWTVRGANAIIALRCNILSGRDEDFWEYKAA